MNKWTREDDAKYKELADRKAAFMAEHKPAVIDALELLLDSDGCPSTNAAIKHADQIRDALKPFDSGGPGR